MLDIPLLQGWPGIGYAAIVAVLLFLGYIGVRRWRSRLPAERIWEQLVIDVAQLPAEGPPLDSTQLTCYGIPVRVAIVVVAPSGRHGKLPAREAMPTLVDSSVPGLMNMLIRDRPQIERWPPQLSTHGFMQAFFANIRLPGIEGKETPWCAVVGRVEFDGRSYLMGLVLCASKPNSLGRIEIDHPGKWLDVLRLRM